MIINNGTIKNYGTVQGNGAVEGNPILYQSGTVVTFWKENSQVTEASYGEYHHHCGHYDAEGSKSSCRGETGGVLC